MVEQGLFNLIQTGLNDPTIKGFPVKLPENWLNMSESQSSQAWTWRSIVSEPLQTLQGQNKFTRWHVQIDCHGKEMPDALTLSRSIATILRGWSGTMTDVDKTSVQAIYQLAMQADGFNPVSRTCVRSNDWLIIYCAKE